MAQSVGPNCLEATIGGKTRRIKGTVRGVEWRMGRYAICLDKKVAIDTSLLSDTVDIDFTKMVPAHFAALLPIDEEEWNQWICTLIGNQLSITGMSFCFGKDAPRSTVDIEQSKEQKRWVLASTPKRAGSRRESSPQRGGVVKESCAKGFGPADKTVSRDAAPADKATPPDAAPADKTVPPRAAPKTISPDAAPADKATPPDAAPAIHEEKAQEKSATSRSLEPCADSPYSQAGDLLARAIDKTCLEVATSTPSGQVRGTRRIRGTAKGVEWRMGRYAVCRDKNVAIDTTRLSIPTDDVRFVDMNPFHFAALVPIGNDWNRDVATLVDGKLGCSMFDFTARNTKSTIDVAQSTREKRWVLLSDKGAVDSSPEHHDASRARLLRGQDGTDGDVFRQEVLDAPSRRKERM